MQQTNWVRAMVYPEKSDNQLGNQKAKSADAAVDRIIKILTLNVDDCYYQK